MGTNSQYDAKRIYAFNYQVSHWTTSAQRAAQTASYLSGVSPVESRAPGATQHHIHWGACKCDEEPCNNDKEAVYQNQAMAKTLHADLNNSALWPTGEKPPAILVFWEHMNIIHLLQQLTGVSKFPDPSHWTKPDGTPSVDKGGQGVWDEEDFDSYLEVYYRTQDTPHHCGIKAGSWGIHPAKERGVDAESCHACTGSKFEDADYCAKRTDVQHKTPPTPEGNGIGVCPGT